VPVIGAALLVLVTSACRFDDLSLRDDDRVDIVTPRALELVKTPFTMRWDADVGAGSRFAVFIDRTVMRPGESLAEYAARACENTTACPASTPDGLESWLRQRTIFRSKRPNLDVQFVIGKGESTEKNTRDTHRAVVVLTDADGRRIGEGAWPVQFRVKQVPL
jgi:hypothetical protein